MPRDPDGTRKVEGIKLSSMKRSYADAASEKTSISGRAVDGMRDLQLFQKFQPPRIPYWHNTALFFTLVEFHAKDLRQATLTITQVSTSDLSRASDGPSINRERWLEFRDEVLRGKPSWPVNDITREFLPFVSSAWDLGPAVTKGLRDMHPELCNSAINFVTLLNLDHRGQNINQIIPRWARMGSMMNLPGRTIEVDFSSATAPPELYLEADIILNMASPAKKTKTVSDPLEGEDEDEVMFEGDNIDPALLRDRPPNPGAHGLRFALDEPAPMQNPRAIMSSRMATPAPYGGLARHERFRPGDDDNNHDPPIANSRAPMETEHHGDFLRDHLMQQHQIQVQQGLRHHNRIDLIESAEAISRRDMEATQRTQKERGMIRGGQDRAEPAREAGRITRADAAAKAQHDADEARKQSETAQSSGSPPAAIDRETTELAHEVNRQAEADATANSTHGTTDVRQQAKTTQSDESRPAAANLTSVSDSDLFLAKIRNRFPRVCADQTNFPNLRRAAESLLQDPRIQQPPAETPSIDISNRLDDFSVQHVFDRDMSSGVAHKSVETHEDIAATIAQHAQQHPEFWALFCDCTGHDPTEVDTRAMLILPFVNKDQPLCVWQAYVVFWIAKQQMTGEELIFNAMDVGLGKTRMAWALAMMYSMLQDIYDGQGCNPDGPLVQQKSNWTDPMGDRVYMNMTRLAKQRPKVREGVKFIIAPQNTQRGWLDDFTKMVDRDTAQEWVVVAFPMSLSKPALAAKRKPVSKGKPAEWGPHILHYTEVMRLGNTRRHAALPSDAELAKGFPPATWASFQDDNHIPVSKFVSKPEDGCVKPWLRNWTVWTTPESSGKCITFTHPQLTDDTLERQSEPSCMFQQPDIHHNSESDMVDAQWDEMSLDDQRAMKEDSVRPRPSENKIVQGKWGNAMHLQVCLALLDESGEHKSMKDCFKALAHVDGNPNIVCSSATPYRLVRELAVPIIVSQCRYVEYMGWKKHGFETMKEVPKMKRKRNPKSRRMEEIEDGTQFVHDQWHRLWVFREACELSNSPLEWDVEDYDVQKPINRDGCRLYWKTYLTAADKKHLNARGLATVYTDMNHISNWLSRYQLPEGDDENSTTDALSDLMDSLNAVSKFLEPMFIQWSTESRFNPMRSSDGGFPLGAKPPNSCFRSSFIFEDAPATAFGKWAAKQSANNGIEADQNGWLGKMDANSVLPYLVQWTQLDRFLAEELGRFTVQNASELDFYSHFYKQYMPQLHTTRWAQTLVAYVEAIRERENHRNSKQKVIITAFKPFTIRVVQLVRTSTSIMLDSN